jgi:hypothetical protein
MPTEQVSARLKTHTISPHRSAIIEMALRAEIDPEQPLLVPPLPYRNPHCFCVNCMGLLWSSRCEIPVVGHFDSNFSIRYRTWRRIDSFNLESGV